MPTYDYKCGNCGCVFEFRSSFSDMDEPVTCSCYGVAERVFSPNRSIFIPSAFARIGNWHQDPETRGPHSAPASANNSVHAPKRKSFTEAFDANYKKAGGIG